MEYTYTIHRPVTEVVSRDAALHWIKTECPASPDLAALENAEAQARLSGGGLLRGWHSYLAVKPAPRG